jgi:hypothetical protein
MLERKLGSRYLAKINSADKKRSIIGSDIPAVSRRMGEEFIVQEFKNEIEKSL